MAVTFINADIDFYKAALARYAAKERCLIEKWSKRLDSVTGDVKKFREFQYLTDSDQSYLRFLAELRGVYNEFLVDIKTPCDSFITDFEWSRVK